MQKISIVITVACLVATQALAQDISGSVMVDERELNTCFQTVERLERLMCYDTVLKRVEISDTVPVSKPSPEQIPKPNSVMFSGRLLGREAVEKDGAFITLINRDSGDTLSNDSEDGAFDLVDPPLDQEQLQTLRQENDLYVAIKSKDGIGEKTILVASCENNITRLKIYFYTPFEGRTEIARFYSGESLSEDNSEVRHMWVRGDGYILENARGLDSIRLLKQLSHGLLGQISFRDGDDVRSSFFDTSPLNTAIPLLSRHCSWRSE